MSHRQRSAAAPSSYSATIKHLRAFLSVARQRSFTRAATELHLSQPSLTMTIRQLEDIAGSTLFDRTTRNVIMTPEGQELFPIAERIVGDFDNAIQNVKMAGESRNSHIRIALVHSMATKVLPRVLRSFLSLHPARVQFREGNSTDVRQWVRRNAVDLGFSSKDEEETDLEFQPLFRDQLGLVARFDHPLLKQGNTLQWAELAGYDFVGLTSDTATGPILTNIPDLPQSITNPKYTVSTNPTLWALLEYGFGITTAPAMAFEFNTNPSLQFCGLSHPVAWRQVFMVTRRGRTLTPVAQTLVRLVKAEVSKIAANHPRIQAR